MPEPVFKTVYRSLNPVETQLMQQALKADGIQSFVDNNYMVGANPLYSQATGGVTLRCYAGDADRARLILSEIQKDEKIPILHTCPKCGSHNTRRVRFEWVFLLFSILLAGIPLFLFRKMQCSDCGKQWDR